MNDKTKSPMDFAPTRNLYTWMTAARKEYYIGKDRPSNTEFDRWMRECGFSRRGAALALDIPLSRVIEFRDGWTWARKRPAPLPSFITRYAMAAVAQGIAAVPIDSDLYDLRDRLAQAAYKAGIEPWPEGQKLTKPPKSRASFNKGIEKTKASAEPSAPPAKARRARRPR